MHFIFYIVVKNNGKCLSFNISKCSGLNVEKFIKNIFLMHYFFEAKNIEAQVKSD